MFLCIRVIFDVCACTYVFFKMTIFASLKYATVVFSLDIMLAVYWILTLIYVSARDPAGLLSGIAFALHYAGMLALATIMDEKSHSDEQSVSSSRNEGGVGEGFFQPYQDKHYPISWGVALCLAAITDTFSLVEVHFSYSEHHIEFTTYVLYTILFSLGLILTIMTFLWITIYYIAAAATIGVNFDKTQQQRVPNYSGSYNNASVTTKRATPIKLL